MEGRRRYVFVIAAVLAFCFVMPRAGAADWQDGPPDGSRWASGKVTVVAFVAAGIGPELRGAIADWNRSDVVHLSLVRTAAAANVRTPCGPVTGAVVVCVTRGSASDRQSAGWTQTYTDATGSMSAGVVWLNLGVVRTLSRADRRSLACHELGHAIGLVHRDGASCMNANSWPVHPDAFDYATLDALYAGTYGP